MLRSSVSSTAVEPRDAAVPAATPATARRIKLLLLTDTAVALAGGSERFLRNLVASLPRERYDVTLVQLADGDAPVPDDARMAHASVLHLPVGAVYGRRGWRALRELSALVRRERFDIVQSQHEKSDVLNALLPRLPGGLRISNRRDMGFKKSARLKRLFRLLNRRFDRVVAPSQSILAQLAGSESVDPARMLWIPNGVDAARFRPPTDAERAAARRRLGLDADTLAFVCNARLSAEKRHADLVDAFAAVRAAHPRTRLFLLGDGPLRADISARAQALGVGDAVEFLGMRSDVDAILPAMDVGVLASTTEGMSNAIMELMACGLPVVATAVGGNPSLVEPDQTGLLVPPLRPQELAARMARLAAAADERRRMGAAARQRIEATYSLAAMVHSYDLMYRQLLDLP